MTSAAAMITAKLIKRVLGGPSQVRLVDVT